MGFILKGEDIEGGHFGRCGERGHIAYDNIHEKLFWRFFKDCDKNIDLILEIHIFLIHQLVCFWEKFVKMPISGPVEA